jgi:HlyD family secretion protein
MRNAGYQPAARLAAVLFLVAACRDNQSLPTFKVEPVRFSRTVTAEGNLKSTKATPLTTPTDAPGMLKVAWIANDGEAVKKDDVIVRFDPTDYENQLLDGNEAMSTATNKVAKNDSDAVTTKKNLRRDAGQAEAELVAAKKFKFDDAEAFSRFQRIESSIDTTLAVNRKQHAQNVLGVRDAMTQADRDLLAIEERKANLKIHNAQQGLHALEMRAPYDGILVLQRDWRGEVTRPGSTVWPGFPIGEIPDLHSMKAEVFVLEADAAGLAVGQKATIAIDGKPGLTFTGKVSQVEKLARPRFPRVPVQYFGATVALDRTDPKVMKPGARVHVILEIENLKNAFSIPRQAVFEKDGKKLVYRKHGEKFDAVPVQIGTSTSGRVVVTKGLSRGDEIALRDPTEKESK